MSLNLACPDWKERLQSGRSLVPPLTLPNRAEGDRAVGIFNKLRLYDVTGTPTMGEAGGAWFRELVWVLFASLDPVTKARLIREIFLLVSKKQNKTTGGALLMLTALLMNARPRAPFLMTAPFQKQAGEAFAAAAGAIALDPVLDKKLHVRDHLKTIVHRETGANLEILTFDPGMVTGKKVVGGLIDELHVLGKMPRAAKAMVQLRGGMVPFPEAFLVTITTQSDDAPAGVFKADLEKARAIRDGKRVGATLPVLYEFPEEMQLDRSKPWLKPANWPMVMPNLGLSVRIETLQEGLADAEAKGDAELRIWASQHLNIQIGVAMGADTWTGAVFWERQATKLTLADLLARSEVVTIGIDGGGLDDMLGLCVMGRETGTGNWLTWCKAWISPIVLERRKSEASKLEDFADPENGGDLEIVEHLPDDVTALAAIVVQVHQTGKLAKIGLDPSRIGIVKKAIEDAKIPEDLMIGISQGWHLMGAIVVVERMLAAKPGAAALWHADQPLMDWCVGNAKIERRGNAILVTKAASGTAKIDPLSALFCAAELMATNPGVSPMSGFLDYVRSEAEARAKEPA